VRGFLAGLKLEAQIIRASPESLIPLVTAPLFTIIFLAIVRQNGRHDLQPDALMAPILIALWWVALQHGGQIITGDRWQALVESTIASPTSLASLLLGRVATVMCLGLLSFFEVWAIGEVMFDVSLTFEHPLAFALTLLCTAFATAGTSVCFASVFVLTRNAYTFTNSAGFPLYLLSGVFVPVAVLPGWIQPISSVIFMSWSADLLRASLKPAAIDDFWARLGVVLLLGAITFVVGRAILFYVLRRMRMTGQLATA
jgi:ABC-2 type transport system permease protein